MVSGEEIERRKRIERHIQNKIDYLKSTTEGFKSSVDKCNPAEIASFVWIVAAQTRELKDIKQLNKSQEEQFDILQREYIQNFNRLRSGQCKCIPAIVEKREMEHG